jgi:ABC-type transporter Mla MlaB component
MWAVTNDARRYVLTVRHDPTGARLIAAGRLLSTWGTSVDVWAALQSLATSGRALVIDASGVTLMDASGIGLFADVIGRWRERGGSASIVGARDRVARLLQLSKVDEA